jgi:thiol:disulfide interchange protein
MRRLALVATVAVLALPLAASARPMTADASHPQAKPFGHPTRATHDVDAALVRARASGHHILLIFGANWCHDSRALAGWFATPRFAAMLAANYEIVWVDVGKKDKNLDLARRFGLDGIAGTPTVLVLDANGKPLNLAAAPTWRNAASRSEDAIYAAFTGG